MTLNQTRLTHYPRLVYPEDDYRSEYYGEVKDGHIPDGQGTLILKNGNPITGNWSNGQSNEFIMEVMGISAGWQFGQQD